MRIARFCAAAVLALREMRAGDDDRLGAGDIGLVDVALVERAVGAIVAIEDERKGLVVADAEETSDVSRAGSVLTPVTSTPSRAHCSRMKRPMCSSPTRVMSPLFRPSRAVPMAMLVGQPPTALEKLAMSSRRPPTCAP